MKLISLNTWGGEVGVSKLQDFLRIHSDADFICLQEIWNGGEEMLTRKSGGSWLAKRVTTLLSDIKSVLPDHEVFYRPHFHDYFGLALFFKKSIKVVEEGELYIYKEKGYISADEFGNHARILQYMTVETQKGLRTVIHLHGLWNGKGKGDSEDRLEQSDRIVNFIKQLTNPFTIVGDFNLRPDTESLRKLEDCGLRNLIRENCITSTRTSFYTKEEKFADYAFVSDEIIVNDFKVLPDEVSDHSPLLLEFK